MAWFRKIKAGLVKSEILGYAGEVGNIFFNIETGELRLSDGKTPYGLPICLSDSDVRALIDGRLGDITNEIVNDVLNDVTVDVQTIADNIIDDMINNGIIAEPTIEAEQTITGTGTIPGGGTTTLTTPPNLKLGTQEIYLNGIRMSEGGSKDYSINSTNINFLNGWELFDGDEINMVYVQDN